MNKMSNKEKGLDPETKRLSLINRRKELHREVTNETHSIASETLSKTKLLLLCVTALMLSLVLGGIGGGLYVYKIGPGFLGFVPVRYGEHSYGKMLDISMAVEKENAVLKGRGSFADSIFNNTYSEYLHDHPYSEFSAHQQRRVFELAFEAGLVNVLNWIADSPEALNDSRQEILHARIDELNRGGDVPFARHDAMYFRQKYYDLKRHHESDLHPDVTNEVAVKGEPEAPAKSR